MCLVSLITRDLVALCWCLNIRRSRHLFQLYRLGLAGKSFISRPIQEPGWGMGWCPQMGSLLESSGSFLLVPGQPVGRPGAWVPWGGPDTCSHLQVLESGVKSGAHVTRPPQCGGCLSAGQPMPGGGEAGMGNVNLSLLPSSLCLVLFLCSTHVL